MDYMGGGSDPPGDAATERISTFRGITNWRRDSSLAPCHTQPRIESAVLANLAAPVEHSRALLDMWLRPSRHAGAMSGMRPGRGNCLTRILGQRRKSAADARG